MWVSEKTWHVLTHSVFQMAGAVCGMQASIKRMEMQMSEQGEQLKALVDKLLPTVAAIDAEVKSLHAKVDAGQVPDPQVAEQIVRLSGINATLQADLPAATSGDPA